jgi:hypothetical protein
MFYLHAKPEPKPLKLNPAALAKARKRGPKQGGSTRRAQSVVRKLASLGVT